MKKNGWIVQRRMVLDGMITQLFRIELFRGYGGSVTAYRFVPEDVDLCHIFHVQDQGHLQLQIHNAFDNWI